MNTEAIFNRIFFCDRCYFLGGPRLNDNVVIFSESEEMFLLYKFKHITREIKTLSRGFTPHLVQFTKSIPVADSDEPHIEYNMTCGVCGVEVVKHPDDKKECVFKRWEKYITRLKDWDQIVDNRI